MNELRKMNHKTIKLNTMNNEKQRLIDEHLKMQNEQKRIEKELSALELESIPEKDEDTSYALIFNSNSQNYIVMDKREDGTIMIRGFKKLKDIMESFNGVTEKWTGHGYESYASAGIYMMQISPKVIEAKDPITLIKYVTEMRVHTVKGGLAGVNYLGLPVSENILELEVKGFNVWKKSMEIAGIM